MPTAVEKLDINEEGLTTTLPRGCQYLGISQSAGYESVKRGDFPCRVIRIGGRIVIPTSELRALLGI